MLEYHHLITDRLTLRPLELSDCDDIVRIAGNLEVSKWLIPVPHPYTRDDAMSFLTSVQKGDLGAHWAIEAKSRFVGVIGIGPGLGYWSDPDIWGQGYMTEAAQAAVGAFFLQTETNEIRSGYFDQNTGSQRVLTKLGFEPCGSETRFSAARNVSVHLNTMVLTRQRWQT